jgi:glycosyltransferase involved in cell wall biosynthesis
VIDAADPEAFPSELRDILADQEELARRGAAGLEFARQHFSPDAVAARFEDLIYSLMPSESVPEAARQ